jgi:hypothetical protein
MIKRIAAISVLAGAVLAGGGAVAFAAPPHTPPPGSGHGATVSTYTCNADNNQGTIKGTGHGVKTPSGNITRAVTCTPSGLTAGLRWTTSPLRKLKDSDRRNFMTTTK